MRSQASRVTSLGPALFLGLAALVGCGDATSVRVVSLEVSPGNTLVVGAGQTARFSASATESSGGLVLPTGVQWASSNPAVATIGSDGTATAVAAGTTTISAEFEGVTGTASLETWIPATGVDYVPGTSYFGRRSYVEYIPGDLPLVLSAPHGGALTPEEIPDRTWGTTATDRNTEETLRAVRDAFLTRTGHAPHVIISHLRRVKLDPNREIEEAAQGSVFAENAWAEFHGFIEDAEEAVVSASGTGLYLDLHGHGHEIRRLELGYLLSASDLNRPNAELDGASFMRKSSIRAMALGIGGSFADLLRGPRSLGGYFEAQGVRAVPGPADPSPGADPYFSGGYNTARHGSRAESRVVSGIQIEMHFPGIRDTDGNRSAFAAKLAWAVEQYMLEHWGFFAP